MAKSVTCSYTTLSEGDQQPVLKPPLITNHQHAQQRNEAEAVSTALAGVGVVTAPAVGGVCVGATSSAAGDNKTDGASASELFLK
jgi:hypothetical protein